MNENKFLNDRFRWVIMLPTKDAEEFEEDDFLVIQKAPNMFSNEYMMVEIESLISEPDYTAVDVLDMTGALAVHEEWTNGVVVRVDNLDDIADDIYPWEGGGMCFLGDMLTSLEKLRFLIDYLYLQTKELVELKDITIRMKKDGPKEPIEDHIQDLFDIDIYSFQFKDIDQTFWWSTIIEEKGLFLVVVDEDLDDEEEDDTKLLPSPRQRSLYDYDDYWDEVYGYDYEDRYYRRT